MTQNDFDDHVAAGTLIPRGGDIKSVREMPPFDVKFYGAVFDEVRALGGDPSKLTFAQVNHVAEQFKVPESVRQFDPAHPVFGRIGDGHIIKWLWDNRETIKAIAKILMMLIPFII